MSEHPFHTRRLELPDGKGWIEIRGEFNPFDLDGPQRELIAMMADWFRQFDRTFREDVDATGTADDKLPNSFADAVRTELDASTRTSHPDPQPTAIQPQKEEKL